MAMKPKKSDGSNTKPYNVRLMTPAEVAGVKKSKAKNKMHKGNVPLNPKLRDQMGSTPKPKASKSLTGEKAAKELQKRTSPKGVKEFEKRASKALDKKYPGLYKKSK